jgi:hypothetical protein
MLLRRFENKVKRIVEKAKAIYTFTDKIKYNVYLSASVELPLKKVVHGSMMRDPTYYLLGESNVYIRCS